MTRFARAKGSKASNEKLPESSTPWSIMKEDLQKAQLEAKSKSKRDEINEERQKNYDKFVEETETKIEKKWAPFPKSNLKTIKKKNPKKRIALNITENDVTDDMIQEMCYPDPQVDGQLKNMTAEIEKALEQNNGNKKKQKKKKNKQVKSGGDNDVDDNDDAPEEASTKIEPQKIIVKKAKNKKQVLKIPSITENEDGKEKKQKDNKNKWEKNKNKKNKTNNVEESGKFEKNQKNNQQKNNKSNNQQAWKVGKNNKYNKQKTNNNNNHQEFGKNFQQKNNTNNYQKQQGQKRKLPKERDDKEHKRRKPDQNFQNVIRINGELHEILKYQGFPVLKSDHERLVELKKSLISKGIPHSEVNKTLKLERRKAEKALSRAKHVVCFQCRESGHLLSECPQLKGNDNSLVESSGIGVCFKCGSTEHTYKECKVNKDFKYAKCFICREQGHISSQCPDNPRGLYPKGGACNLCGDVTHLKKDCPKHIKEQQDNQIFLNKISNGNIESLEANEEKPKEKKKVVNKKVVKF